VLAFLARHVAQIGKLHPVLLAEVVVEELADQCDLEQVLEIVVQPM
jgi:hypothetical protein